MSRSDDRQETTLPVTSEVGSEGGSFADPTMQVETFSDDPGNPRTSGAGGASSVATQATRFDTIAAGGISGAPDPSAGMVRYATEPPVAPAAAEGRRGRSPGWRAGLIGAAAGVAVAAGLMRRRTRRG